MDKRPSLDEYFMALAKIASVRSTCNSRHNGCIIVKNKQILSTGYNGALPGYKHCSDYIHPCNEPFCSRRNIKISDINKQSFCIASHAESNAVAQAAKKGISIEGSTAYCTLSPCFNCLKIMAIAGVKEIVYEYNYESINKIRDMFWKNQIELSGIKSKELWITDNSMKIFLESLEFPTAKRRIK